MDSSDYISILALITAIVMGLINYFYTKKTYEASNYPLLKIWDITTESGAYSSEFRGHRLDCCLQNSSKEHAIVDLQISYFIAQPGRIRKEWIYLMILCIEVG